MPRGKGKTVSREQSVISKLKDMVGDAKMYYIVFKYAPQLLDNDKIKTFDDLRTHYAIFTTGMTERVCKNWLLEEQVQTAIIWLLGRLHQQKKIELYELYFNKAKDDVQAFKAFDSYSTRFFAAAGKDDLHSLVRNANIENSDEDTNDAYDFMPIAD